MSGEMLQNVCDLRGCTVRDIMVPRTRMAAIEDTTSLDDAVRILRDEGHSRVPVYRGQVDNVTGVLFAKDLFHVATNDMRAADGRKVESLDALARRPVLFVTEAQTALSVLRDMQARRMLLAVVLDEFGAVKGLVTLEDILEELVGDIQDEHDSTDADDIELVALGEGRWIASAAMAVADLADRIDLVFPEGGDYASLGGFLAARAGKVPEPGTVVLFAGWRFVVREGDKRRATKVEIVREPRSPTMSPVPTVAP